MHVSLESTPLINSNNNNSLPEFRTMLYYLLVAAIVRLLLSLSNTIVGFNALDAICDNVDNIGLNVAQYLLVGGISSSVMNFTLVVYLIMILREQIVTQTSLPLVYALYMLFYISLFVVGLIIIFRSNSECLNAHSTHIIYALILCCVDVGFAFVNCIIRTSR